MESPIHWYTKPSCLLPLTVLLVWGCSHYLTSGNRMKAEQKRMQQDVVEIAHDTLHDELYGVVSGLQIRQSYSLDITPYKRTNSSGSTFYDFDRLSSDLILLGRKGISSGTNLNDSIDFITKGGYLQGLQIAIGALEEAEEMNRTSSRANK